VPFLQGIRDEDMCEPRAEDFDRPGKRLQNEIADVNPDPNIKQKTRLTLCPTLPSLCTEANTNDFFFFLALPINPVAKTFRIKLKLRCYRCHARAHCFIAGFDPCIAQPSIRIKELRPPYYCQIFRSRLCRV